MSAAAADRLRVAYVEEPIEMVALVDELARLEGREDRIGEGIVKAARLAWSWVESAAQIVPGGARAMELLRAVFVGAESTRSINVQQAKVLISMRALARRIAGERDSVTVKP